MQFKPLGIILTRMRWRQIKWLAFNIGLFTYQLAMLSTAMVIGTIYKPVRIKITWRQIWRAAQYCHVRLVLRPDAGDYWKALSVTAPEARLESWSPGMVAASRGRFVYMTPAFLPGKEEIGYANDYADELLGNPVARKYDFLQLLSYLVNLICWLFWWPCWGKEVIKIMNLPGAREVCSSVVAAIVRYVANRECMEKQMLYHPIWMNRNIGDKVKAEYIFKQDRGDYEPHFFKGYSTSMVSPCLVAVSGHWREAA